MISKKKLTVAILLGVVALAFLLGMNTYQRRVQNAQAQKVSQESNRLVRPHAMVFGPVGAPVTIVEFFDPACESCRAFYPVVKDLLKQYPKEVRLVIRYAPFHQGSDAVVALLEASRQQGLYQPVLESLLQAQPLWADHGQPNIGRAFQAAKDAGLDLPKALEQARTPEIAAVIRQDIEDLQSLQVTGTPTFFVNGRSLPQFGQEPLARLVAEEVAKSRQ